MKKIYLLVAALLSTVALTKATTLKVYNDTGQDIKVSVNGSSQTRIFHLDDTRDVTIKNKKKFTFTGMGRLGGIDLSLANDYGRFSHAYTTAPLSLFNGITITRSKKTYFKPMKIAYKPKKREGMPKIIQTWPLIRFKWKDYGDFKRRPSLLP